MIAKIMKGSGFKGVINYIFDLKKGTELSMSSVPFFGSRM